MRFVPPFYTDDFFVPSDEIERRDIERLSAKRAYRFNQPIFEQGSAPAAVFTIVTGVGVLSRVDVNGAPLFARVVHPGEILGVTETLAGIPFDATLRAMSRCACQRMDQRGLLTLLRRRPLIRQRILHVLAANYGRALANAAAVSHLM